MARDEPDTAQIVADPQWFAHRYDFQRDEIHFVRLPRESHRSGRFLSDPELTSGAPRRVLPRRAAAGVRAPGHPLHLILHSGLTCSTLLARALEQAGAAMTLIEPPILSDLVAHRLRGGPAAPAEALDDVIALLARPFAPGEAVILKSGSVGDSLGADILARNPASLALCLYAPLPVFLASIARKGLWGRLWGRKLFMGLRNARLIELGFSDADYLEQTDLQVAACAWLCLHRIMAGAAARFGPARVRSIDSERLSADLGPALTAIAAHFQLPVDRAAIAEVVEGPLLRRHAKTGEGFDPARRAAEIEEARRLHGDEIEKVEIWIRKVAETVGAPWELPSPLEAS